MSQVANAPLKVSIRRTAFTGIALALAPFVAVFSIASVMAPVAEARMVVCHRAGNSVMCY